MIMEAVNRYNAAYVFNQFPAQCSSMARVMPTNPFSKMSPATRLNGRDVLIPDVLFYWQLC